MKIAMLGPITREISRKTTGSRPKLVYDLSNYLTKQGHEVTVYGSADSKVNARLVSVVPQSIYSLPTATDNPFYIHTSYLSVYIEEFLKRANEYDIINNHFYPEYFPLHFTRFINTPIVTTTHFCRIEDIKHVYKYFPNTYYVAISEDQIRRGKPIKFIGIVRNGIDISDFLYNDTPKDYLLFFGRMKFFKDAKRNQVDPKGVTDAIKVAELLNEKLIIAGNCETQDFFDKTIKPHLNDKITFPGPVDALGPFGLKEKVKLYQNAKTLLFPSNWDEGLPLVPLEAMACGTPVIAYYNTSLPEEIIDGKTGYIVPKGDYRAMAKAVKKIDQIKRKDCRKHIENNFTTEVMGRNYEELYKKILAKRI